MRGEIRVFIDPSPCLVPLYRWWRDAGICLYPDPEICCSLPAIKLCIPYMRSLNQSFYSNLLLFHFLLLLLLLHAGRYLPSFAAARLASTPTLCLQLLMRMASLYFPDLMLMLLAGFPDDLLLAPPFIHHIFIVFICAGGDGLPHSFATTSLPLLLCCRVHCLHPPTLLLHTSNIAK